MSARHMILMLGFGTLCLAGCLSPVRQDVDSLVCKRAELEMDVPPPGFVEQRKEPTPLPPSDKKTPTFLERMRVPPGLPGSEAPEMKLERPKDFDKLDPKQQTALLAQWNKYFPAQMDIGADPKPLPGPEGRPLTLADLQKLAREHSPLLIQAASDIQAADGAMVQAGLYNNPVFGYLSSAQSLTNGSIMGPAFSQTIVTMGKRKLAAAAAKMDLENARLAYRKTETDVMASVRSAYFAVLVAQEAMRANRALVELTDQVYKVMLIQLKGGQVAGYEPAQVSVYAGQARVAYIQARNGYLLAWKNLAAAIGLKLMPVTELSGSVTRGLPRFDPEKALAYILQNHTDIRTANNGVDKARYNLRLAQVTAVPDVTIGGGFLWDTSIPRTRIVPLLVNASVPVPIFDRNQGGIRQAQGALMHAVEEPHRVQNTLTAAFAEAYRRMEENRLILELYHKQLLFNQIHAFRATVKRHFFAGPVEVPGTPGSSTSYLTDLIATEQNVVNLIGSYLTFLGMYWQAVADTASLLQLDNLYDMAQQIDDLPQADLRQLLSLPCCHPCSSVPVVPGVAPATGLRTGSPASPPPPASLEGILGNTDHRTESVRQPHTLQQPAPVQEIPRQLPAMQQLPAISAAPEEPPPVLEPPPSLQPPYTPETQSAQASEGGAR